MKLKTEFFSQNDDTPEQARQVKLLFLSHKKFVFQLFG